MSATPGEHPSDPGPVDLPGSARHGLLSRRGVLQRAAAVSAVAALWRPGRTAASAGGPAATAAGGVPAGAIPGLDELAGQWMPAATLLNLPAVNNFHGGLQAGPSLLSFANLTFPPLSQGLPGECGRLALNGVNVQAQEARWYPYQVLRRATMGAIALQSALRMGFEQQTVLIELQVSNTGKSAAPAHLEVELAGYLRSYPGTWQWGVPRPWADFSAWSGQLADSGRVLVVADSGSPAAAAFAFPAPPDQLAPSGNSGSARWNLTLQPGQQRTIQLVMAAASSAAAAAASAAAARDRFAAMYAHAKAGWEQRFTDAFTPGNPHFSGHLPVLETPDQQLRDLYYRSVVSLLQLERTSYPLLPRFYATAGPQWAVTDAYFWDTSLFAPILVLLDPVIAREQAQLWLKLGIYNGYAVDGLSGQLVGPWYSANDVSVFTVLLTYVTFTSDTAFLDQQIAGTSVIDHMQAIALHWQQLEVPTTGLADYGGLSNLLEEVPSYVNQVPSLNAANVWMMRQLAALRQMRGETTAAGQLRQQASDLANRVLALYVAGQGVWQTVHDDGTRATVRHVYDFDTIGRLLTSDLTPAMRSEMTRFVTSELLADGWMRALSLSDPDAAASTRPDHGSNGAYDTWPAQAASVMGRFGNYPQMLQMLHTFDSIGGEGPFAQAHQLVPEPGGLVAWDRDDLNPATALTVTAWINPASWPADYWDGSIVAKDGWSPANVGYVLRGGGAGVISFTAAIGGNFLEARSTATVPAGSWHHVAGTYDGQHLAVYIDGNLAATSPASGPISPAAGTNLMAGADPFDPERRFTGAIDEVRVYNRSLTAGEIAALASAVAPDDGTSDPALVLRLPMDEGHGQTTVDTVTGLQETLIAARWVPGRYGNALAFTKPTQLTTRIAYYFGQAYNESSGASFAATIIQDLFGYAPDGAHINISDQATPRGIKASLHSLSWQGAQYTLTSTSSGIQLTPHP